MTTVAVLADPPREGLVLPGIVETTPLSAADATELYAAALADVLGAVEASGGELLVNYRPEKSIPNEHTGGESAESQVREVASAALAEPAEARYEVQVGETFAGRAGNTATHLLDQEDVESVAIVPGSAAFLDRTAVDGAAMKLRGSEVVLGPGIDGDLYYAGFKQPIDFAEAYRPPAIETITERARAVDCEVDFLSTEPTLETPSGLANAVTLYRARSRADRIVPAHTAACIEELGLAFEEHDGRRELIRE
jgi:hypothetical protein